MVPRGSDGVFWIGGVGDGGQGHADGAAAIVVNSGGGATERVDGLGDVAVGIVDGFHHGGTEERVALRGSVDLTGDGVGTPYAERTSGGVIVGLADTLVGSAREVDDGVGCGGGI